jgi:hypothetical protein
VGIRPISRQYIAHQAQTAKYQHQTRLKLGGSDMKAAHRKSQNRHQINCHQLNTVK